MKRKKTDRSKVAHKVTSTKILHNLHQQEDSASSSNSGVLLLKITNKELPDHPRSFDRKIQTFQIIQEEGGFKPPPFLQVKKDENIRNILLKFSIFKN